MSYLVFFIWTFLNEKLVEVAISAIAPFINFKDEEQRKGVSKTLALAIPTILTPLAGIDIFAFLGFEFPVPYIGAILTGLLFSQGSSFVHDLLKFVEAKKEIVQSKN